MIISDQQPCARRSSSARLLGVRDRLVPVGTVNICQAGIDIKATNETAIIKSKSSDIRILTLDTAATNARVRSIVNDYSYRSVSADFPIADSSQRKRPLQPAARRWDLVILPEGMAQGEENLRLNSGGVSSSSLSPDRPPSCHAPDAAIIALKQLAIVPSASAQPKAAPFSLHSLPRFNPMAHSISLRTNPCPDGNEGRAAVATVMEVREE